jgi:hypothetical protein
LVADYTDVSEQFISLIFKSEEPANNEKPKLLFISEEQMCQNEAGL